MNVMQLLLKRYKRKVNKVIKGGSVLSILFSILISLIIPPFNILASTQTIIVPTYSSSSTESTWSSHLHIENYCEGTNVSTNSCILKFTVDDYYYGMISFDAYNGSTKWIDYQNVFIAGGYGEYHYNFWNNGQIVMNNVNINAVSLVLPDSNVDLTQIIQLLTAIESDTSSIDLLVNQTKTEIINVLNQLVISNGYLETLTKLRTYNFPIESFPYIYKIALTYPTSIYDVFVNGNYSYPIFKLNYSQEIFDVGGSFEGTIYEMVLFIDKNTSSIPTLENYIYIDGGDISDLKYISRSNHSLLYCKITRNTSSGSLKVRSNVNNLGVIPIYLNLLSYPYKSTDFAIQFGLRNEILDNLSIIANGTNNSNQSSQGLETQKSSFDTTSNNLYNSENTFNNDMNNKLQSIDTSFNPSTSFGSKFLSSADWVRTQFNNLTSTSPFGTVLSFSMLLGLSLLIIGKVFK